MRSRPLPLLLLLALISTVAGCLTGLGPAKQAGARAERDKASLEAQVEAGKAYSAAEEWNDAFVVFRRATLLDGSNYDAQLGLARACAELGETKVGLDAAESASEARPQEAAPLATAA